LHSQLSRKETVEYLFLTEVFQDPVHTNHSFGAEIQIVSGPLIGPSKVKQEIFNKLTTRRVSRNYEDRQKRLATRSIALRDPNGAPRKTFRRGCQAATITTVLGGSPMSAAPIVMNIPSTKPSKLFPDGIFPHGKIHQAGGVLFPLIGTHGHHPFLEILGSSQPGI
jgi:hypothetical protein